jgi:hypothetical protein
LNRRDIVAGNRDRRTDRRITKHPADSSVAGSGDLIAGAGVAEKLLEVPQGLIHTALDLERQEGSVIADRIGERDCIFLAGLHGAAGAGN